MDYYASLMYVPTLPSVLYVCAMSYNRVHIRDCEELFLAKKYHLKLASQYLGSFGQVYKA